MALNIKLFHLGNDVIRIAKNFEKTFPKDRVTGKNELGECFMDLLKLINEIRLAIQEGDVKKEIFNFKVNCTEKEMLAVRKQIEVLELTYELTKSQTKSEE